MNISAKYDIIHELEGNSTMKRKCAHSRSGRINSVSLSLLDFIPLPAYQPPTATSKTMGRK
jgi:hypothetical protein